MQELIDSLAALKREHRLRGVKGGTEVEAMTFEEIALMRRLSEGILPMTVKIGGPEARNDIEFMVATGIDCILAPMIESPYGLRNFVEAAASLDPDRSCALAVNIETITAYEKLESIFGSPFFGAISKVTVGRSDLSGSMGLPVDAPEVIAATRDILSRAARLGKATSVGGQVNPENALLVADSVGPDYINTRHMSVASEPETIRADIAAVLEWEAAFYRRLYELYPARRSLYLSRISSIQGRLATSSLPARA